MISVSVVILNHNYARFLPTTVSSALNQTHDNVEVIVVDDASTDNSRQVLDQFDGLIKTIVHETNLGQGAAINSGAAAASGQVVWFLDADDALLPQACRTAAEAFNSEPQPAKFHTPLAIVDGDGYWAGELLPANPARLAEGDVADHVLTYRSHGWPPMSGNAYSADALVRVLPVPAEEYRQAADSFLNEQVAICGPLVRSQEPVAAYREHGANQFAGTALDIGWLRTKIRRELISHERLGLVAWQRQLEGYKANAAAVSDVAFLGYRLASLRLDPEGHPPVDPTNPDTRAGLARRGIGAAMTNPQLAWSDRLLRSLWFPVIAAAPSLMVGRLLSWYQPDGPSQPVWRRRRKRTRQESAQKDLLVPPAQTKDLNGGS